MSIQPGLKRFALVACDVLAQEINLICGGSPHIISKRLFAIGLHDQPDLLRQTLQAELALLSERDDIDAIVLVYGLCGYGTVGLQSRRHPLVIPRAHDCITLFMGDKERYSEHQRNCPTCYYYTPGWNQARRVPGPDRLDYLRAELPKKFDEDNVEFLIATEYEQWQQPKTAVYLDLGTANTEPEAVYAKHCADWLGWKFQHIHGDPTLLKDLLWCRWDERRFQIIQPGNQLQAAMNEAIMSAGPINGKTVAA